MFIALTLVAGVGLAAVALVVLHAYLAQEPCPTCGSRLPANGPRDKTGKLQDTICSRCGCVYTPAWMRSARDRGGE